MQRLRLLWQQRPYLIGITFILAIATFMRFYHLASLPPGLFPDEAANGLDVFRILEQHHFQPFYATNGGREALFFYLQAFWVQILGNTTLALRIAPALIGVAAVGATYLWAKTWFNRRVALVAALLMAVSPWAVTISRDGFRAGMVALMVPLCTWLYTKALQTRRPAWYLSAGAATALGLYTYISFRAFILITIVGAILLVRRQRRFMLAERRNIAMSVLIGVVLLIPLGVYGLQHPHDLIGRSGGVSFTNAELNGGNPAQALLSSIGKTALMFNIHGDPNYRHNLSGQPELNVFVGVMFLLGIGVCISRRRSLRYSGLLIIFAGMLAPEVVTAEGIPHALRAIGALPPSMILAAIGMSYMLALWRRVFPLNVVARASGTAALTLLLLLTIYQGYSQYFYAWANTPAVYPAYYEDVSALADYYNDTPTQARRVVLANQYDTMPLEYLTHGHATYARFDQDMLAVLPATGQREYAVLTRHKRLVLPQLQQRFPEARLARTTQALVAKSYS